ncbi:MAG TPA: M23 family metallopeptidase [Thermoanaerobaculia bacterium]|nr:M23 family metallopeptidase [Thermoanaerobaculia bacterium]
MNRWWPRLALIALLLAALGTEALDRSSAAGRPADRAMPGAAVAPPFSLSASGARGVEAAAVLAVAGGDRIAIPVVGIEKASLRNDFGLPRGGGRSHQAIDILAPRGTPVVAAVDGEILKLFRSPAGGITLYLADPAKEKVFYYAHLDRYAAGIAEGEQVRRGEVIAFVGTSGNAPRDVPHLHFAVERLPAGGEWWKGVAENPYPLLMEKGITVRLR